MDRLASLRVFQRVVEDGGFAAAARSLDMSPAVVTRLVADLEEHLGARLLQRTTRRVTLTDAGEAYLERVRHILQDIDDAHALVSSQTQDLSGTLRVLAPPVLASYVLAPLITGFRERYPKILLDIEVDTPRELPIESYDVTLMGTNEGFDANIVARRIVSSEAILVASPAYVARRGMPAVPEDLVLHDCLRHKPLATRGRLWRLYRSDRAEERREIDVKPVVWANHTDTLLRAALDGAGITSTTLELVAPHLASGALVRVLSPWITERLSLYAALPSRKFVPQRTRVFVDYLAEKTQRIVEDAMDACATASKPN